MAFGAWDGAGVAVKALVYAATLCAAGGVFFDLYNGFLLSLVHRHRVRRWVSACVGVAIVMSAIRLVVLAGSMDESTAGMFDASMIGMVLQGGEARATGVRLVGLALIGGGLCSARRAMTTTWSPGGTAALAGAVAAATSFAWIGHAWAARNGGLSIALLGVHLMCVAFWVGALMPLFLVGHDGEIDTFAAIARRFGNLAVSAVVLLLHAGALLLCTLLAHVAQLWTTDYGRLVSVKLAGAGALLAAAAWNKLRLTPRLQEHDRPAMIELLRSITVEMLLAVLILGVTATMTSWVGPAGR